jgi:PKD repeat protein
MNKRLRRLRAVLAITPLVGSFVLVAAPVAQAATPSETLHFSGSQLLQHRFAAIGCSGCISGDNDLGARVNLDISADWKPDAVVTQQYSDSLIRQGETLDLVNTLQPGSGPLTVTYAVHGDAGVYNFDDGSQPQFPADGSEQDVAHYNFSTAASTVCALKLDGDGGYNCSATKEFTLYDATFLGQGLKVTLPITTTLSISPDGVITTRSVTVGGTTYVGPGPLEFHGPSPAVTSDPVVVPCTAPVGTEMLYDLASTTTSPGLSATTSADIKVSVTIIFTVDATFHLATIGPDVSTMTLTAPTTQVDLGAIQADNKPPVISSPDSYGGTEGSAVQLTAAGTTDNCASTLNYVWHLSDGGVAYGISPHHTFTDNGTYSGLLEVTDAAGNTSTHNFSVTVDNATPGVNAGPDGSGAWGRSVAFNGSAVDPGSGDQSTLSYAWDFGDGTPSATGGPSVTHAYSLPGTYTATLSVCDKDGACASDTRAVQVRRRNVSLGYLGDTSGVYDQPAAFSASLVDEFGQAVPGRPVSFAVGSEAEGTVATSSGGQAATSHVLGLAAGAYTAAASFAGDSLYAPPADGTASFSVARKASSVGYTGALTGGANKSVTLSAVLKDASGTALAGRTIVFVLGSQTVSATTNASGVATASLKLAQKNGTYPLTATWTPAGLDASRYLGSSSSSTFKLQAR